MISTFDLTLLGGMVSMGGLAFLRQPKWPSLGLRRLPRVKSMPEFSKECLKDHARSTALASARWLTVGILTLLIGYAHGEDHGYLFGPWSDVLFHMLFVSTCWTMTVYRINRAALGAFQQDPVQCGHRGDDSTRVVLYAAADDKHDVLTKTAG